VVGKQGKGRGEAQYLSVEEEDEASEDDVVEVEVPKRRLVSLPKAGGAIKKEPAAAGRPTAANRP
jgi:hypothetical protein